MSTIEAAATVSDHSGKLLFYTEGSTIWDRNHNIMLHGDSLTGSVHQNSNQRSVTGSTVQGALIIPWSDDRYFVFSLTQSETFDDMGKLFYSLVDMSLNNGNGAVVLHQKGILLDSMLLEGMAAITGDNGNVWVLVHSRTNAVFKAFEVSCSGVRASPVVSTTGSFIPNVDASSGGTEWSFIGMIAVAPNGRKIALANFPDTNRQGNLELYDFDPLTGMVKNPILLTPSNSSLYCRSAIFSPNSSKLYAQIAPGIRGIYQLFQYNLILPTMASIINSRTLIDSCRGSLMRHGPDGRIYVLRDQPGQPGSNQNLCRINSPDALGLLCNFEQNVLNNFRWHHLGFGSEVPAAVYKPVDTFYRSFCIQTCFSDTTLQYRGNHRYLWYNGDTASSLSVSEAGVYWVSVTKECDMYIDTYHVYKYPLPQISVLKGCTLADSVYAIARFPDGDTTSYLLSWLDKEYNLIKYAFVSGRTDTLKLLPGPYLLNISIAGPCDASRFCDTFISFSIDPAISHVASFISDTILCQNHYYRFQNTSTSNIDKWYWDFGDGNTSVEQSPQHAFVAPGKYRITFVGYNYIPCYDTFYRDIMVDTTGQVHFTTNKAKLCAGEYVSFYPTYSGKLAGLYWDLGDGSNDVVHIEPELQHAYDKEGRYTVSLKGKFRVCPDHIFTDTLQVYPLPVVNLGKDTFLCLNGSSILLSNTVNNLGKHSQIWNTGSVTDTIGVWFPGTYALTITSEQGCSNEGVIEVKKDCYTDIPNAFTPNGDGLNDYFFPRQLLSKSVIAFRLQIFNRWGQVVFESNKKEGRGWDGRFNHKEQTSGVYVYLVEIELANGVQERYEGNVTLIR